MHYTKIADLSEIELSTYPTLRSCFEMIEKLFEIKFRNAPVALRNTPAFFSSTPESMLSAFLLEMIDLLAIKVYSGTFSVCGICTWSPAQSHPSTQKAYLIINKLPV